MKLICARIKLLLCISHFYFGFVSGIISGTFSILKQNGRLFQPRGTGCLYKVSYVFPFSGEISNSPKENIKNSEQVFSHGYLF